MIEAQDLTKSYGGNAAVDHLTFTVEPGRVTGFLGPNGAGKSTTMRLIMGLDRPTAGTALDQRPALPRPARPLRTVGALLEARAVHPGRPPVHHLLFLAQTQGLPARRVDEVLDLVGLQDVAGQAGRRLLARHEPAAGRGRGAARRPAGAAARRAGQRARPGGHPVDPDADEAASPPRAAPSWCPAT